MAALLEVPMSLRLSMCLVPALVLAACGEQEGGDECEVPAGFEVAVTVLSPSGDPVMDAADISIDGVDCVNNGDGTYACTAEPDAPGQLSIIDTRFTGYAKVLPLPEPACQNDVFPITAQLATMMGS
jgi:hypothetical protein